MKTHFILFAMCGLGLLINAEAMTVEDQEVDEFHHGFSMSDEMDEDEEMLSLLNDQEMEDDDLERMADPLRIHIRIRRPQPLGFGIGGYAGLGGLGLSRGFGLGFDEDESHEDEESMRSSDPSMENDRMNTEDEERKAGPMRSRLRVPPRYQLGPRFQFKDEDMRNLMADPLFRIRLRIRFGRPLFRFGRRFRVFFGRRRPFFFDNQNSDDDFSERSPRQFY